MLSEYWNSVEDGELVLSQDYSLQKRCKLRKKIKIGGQGEKTRDLNLMLI